MYDFRFLEILSFLNDNPEMFSKNRKYSLFKDDDIVSLHNLYLKSKNTTD